jgi:hypothetical protein
MAEMSKRFRDEGGEIYMLVVADVTDAIRRE